MNIQISGFILLVCGTLPFVYSEEFFQESVQSHIFKPLRPKHPPKGISECDIVVTEPYGVLEQTYKRGEVKEGATCSWTLHAPANHVVNIISVRLSFLDKIPAEHPDGLISSRVEISDDAFPSEFPRNHFSSVGLGRAGNVFAHSISTKQDTHVKIRYYDIKGFATQQIAVKYEFLNVDDMTRLQKAYNG